MLSSRPALQRQRPPLADSEHARGQIRARAEGVGLGGMSQGVLPMLVAIATQDISASGQADEGNEQCSGGRWRVCTMKATANRIRATTEMAVLYSPSMANVRWFFGADSPSSVPEVRSHFSAQLCHKAEVGDRPIRTGTR